MLKHRRLNRTWYQADERGISYCYKKHMKVATNRLYHKIACAIAVEQLLEATQEREEREEAERLDDEQWQNSMELMYEQDMLAQMCREDDCTDPQEEARYLQECDDDFDDYEYEQQQRRREQAYLENDDNWTPRFKFFSSSILPKLPRELGRHKMDDMIYALRHMIAEYYATRQQMNRDCKPAQIVCVGQALRTLAETFRDIACEDIEHSLALSILNSSNEYYRLANEA